MCFLRREIVGSVYLGIRVFLVFINLCKVREIYSEVIGYVSL